MKKEIQFIEAQIESTGGINDGMPRGTDVSDKTGRIAAMLADQKGQYEWTLVESIKKKQEIENTINQVEDPILARLLYDRYIENMSWKETAKDLPASESYTRGDLHKKALAAVTELIVQLSTQ